MNTIPITKTVADDIPITQTDMDAGKLILRKRSSIGNLIPTKKRVTLYLDTTIVEYFEQIAGKRGYQTLMKEALKASMAQTNLELTLRKIIREELNLTNSAG